MANLAVRVSIVLVLLVALADSSPVKLCCTQYHESPIPVKALKLGTVQEITGFCNIKAVIFKTVKNKLVCTNPDSEWVKAAMETVPMV
ncbi:C-C motif chemokine 20 [Sphaeramia orbicularis]|uniref:C-C motif chemokine 20 n=1 Tax=Sphaeramia orbicularis TaxID=375764 RepID=UPI0011802BAD|nr:C-C motif chemokine 20-like [Sphaeramia orbicularis]